MSIPESSAAASLPTIVLVHGAFADGGSWAGVVDELLAAGLHVLVPANPLRGIAADSAYLSAVLDAVDRPVLLVGHSYGGVVITNAGASAANAVGLVYVAAFAPDDGETLEELGSRFPAVPLLSALRLLLVPVGSTDASEAELSIDPALFHDAFAADVSTSLAVRMATSQRPIAASAFTTPSSGAAWKTLPSWFAVATDDRAIHPDEQRFFAKRAGSVTVEIAASHAVAVSHAAEIADLIRTAANTVG